jgi:predicted anti-sigma-YlaC factor YlaD
MKPHFTEADLLETYYTKPGESLPVMMHLADCADCAGRYERLESKMRGLRSCHRDEKPETFWARQRISVMRKIDQQRERRATMARISRVAAAAMLVLVLGGLLTWKRVDEPASPRVVETTAATTLEDSKTRSLDDSTADPWQSEELKDYSSMVNWESWVENGDHS